VPIGKAAIAHEGSDVTVVSVSMSVQHCLDVAEELEGTTSVEVLDLRSIVPLDREAILTSVAKTGKLVIVDEDYKSFGLSGEIIATIADKDPSMLKAPVERVCYPDIPVPYARVLEYEALPTRDKIKAAIAKVTA
jgi:pyruvate/2-oxoglutarate/acetoin dehydrogenase E1 component